MVRLLGDEDSDKHKVSVAVLARVMGSPEKAKKDAESEEAAALTKSLCNAVEASICKILRSGDAEWEEHVAAVHGVTAVLEVNKKVGAWLLRQESIFWSLAEAAEMEDEDLSKSLAEIYAHAANDQQHFRDEAGNEPIKHLKAMLKSPKPRVRCRA